MSESVWIDEVLVEKAKQRVITKYGIENINSSIDVSNLSINDLRDLATLIAEVGYDSMLYNKIDYKEKRILEEKLNKEVDKRLGEQASKIFNILDKKLNTEKWNGDERFRLMNLCNRKGYSEMQVLKNTVWYMSLIGKEITADRAYELQRLLTCGLYWAFGNEKGLSEEPFSIRNQARKKEIDVQDAFVNYCLEQKFDKAYELIKKDVNEELGIK